MMFLFNQESILKVSTKKKNLIKKLLTMALSASMLLSYVPAYATSKKSTSTSTKSTSASELAKEQQALTDLQNKVSETQEQIEKITFQQEQNEKTKSALVSQQEVLQAKYDQIKVQADAVNAQMSTAQSNIDSLNEYMDDLSQQLDELEAEQQAKYEDMKKRIQFFYENDYGKSLLTIFIESGSLSGGLDSVTSVGRIMEYDRNALDEMEKTAEEIKKKQEEADARAADITAFQESLTASAEQLNALRDAAGADLSDKNSELFAINANSAEYAKQIESLQQVKSSLEAQTAQAQSALAKKISTQMAQATTVEYTGGSIPTGTDEVMLLAATIQGEAWNQPYEGKLAVGSVIANRVKSRYFPNTITGVITAPRQFSAYSCGLVNKYLQTGVDATCLEIAQKVVAGTRNGNWLFFMTKPWADHFGIVGYQLIGAHAFFRVWGNNTGQNYTQNTDDAIVTDPAANTTPTVDPNAGTATAADPNANTGATTDPSAGGTTTDPNAGGTTTPTNSGTGTTTPSTDPANGGGTTTGGSTTGGNGTSEGTGSTTTGGNENSGGGNNGNATGTTGGTGSTGTTEKTGTEGSTPTNGEGSSNGSASGS